MFRSFFGFSGRSPWAVCFTIAVAAFVVRLAAMAFLYQDSMDPERDHWMFAHEQGKVAQSIALGRGFANPLFGETGPTAFAAPVYPYFMAAIFKLFGIFTNASAIVIIAFNCLFSALTTIPLYFYARWSFGERTAILASWIWVILPYSVFWTIMRVWDTWMTALLLGILFLLALKLGDQVSHWAGFGLLSGITALVNPVVLSVLPPLGFWMTYRLHKEGRRWLLPAATAALCAVAVMSPWAVRNYLVFHRLIPVRDNLGFELYVGNAGNNVGPYDIVSGPWKNSAEWERFQKLGEIAYFDEKGRLGAAFVKAHPGMYAVKTVRRLVNVWTDFWSLSKDFLAENPYSPVVAVLCTILSVFTLCGLWRAWRQNALDSVPYLIVLFFYPVVYCFTHTADWYRRPIDPFFVVLAAYGLAGILPQASAATRGSRAA